MCSFSAAPVRLNRPAERAGRRAIFWGLMLTAIILQTAQDGGGFFAQRFIHGMRGAGQGLVFIMSLNGQRVSGLSPDSANGNGVKHLWRGFPGFPVCRCCPSLTPGPSRLFIGSIDPVQGSVRGLTGSWRCVLHSGPGVSDRCFPLLVLRAGRRRQFLKNVMN